MNGLVRGRQKNGYEMIARVRHPTLSVFAQDPTYGGTTLLRRVTGGRLFIAYNGFVRSTPTGTHQATSDAMKPWRDEERGSLVGYLDASNLSPRLGLRRRG